MNFFFAPSPRTDSLLGRRRNGMSNVALIIRRPGLGRSGLEEVRDEVPSLPNNQGEGSI